MQDISRDSTVILHSECTRFCLKLLHLSLMSFLQDARLSVNASLLSTSISSSLVLSSPYNSLADHPIAVFKVSPLSQYLYCMLSQGQRYMYSGVYDLHSMIRDLRMQF